MRLVAKLTILAALSVLVVTAVAHAQQAPAESILRYQLGQAIVEKGEVLKQQAQVEVDKAVAMGQRDWWLSCAQATANKTWDCASWAFDSPSPVANK